MKKHLSKKRVVLAAIVVVALAIASGVAYAYFTSSGSNTGTAGVGGDTGLTVVQKSGTAPSGLVPGGPSQNIVVTVTNGATFAQAVKTIAVSVTATDKVGCDAGWFNVTNPVVSPSPYELGTSGPSASHDFTGSISMTETHSDQSACKGAALTLSLNAS
jgi:hypothetical protein